MVELKRIDFMGFKGALELNNGIVKLIVSVDVGPRVLFYGFVNGQNFFHIFADQSAPINDDQWHSYGGHRLWYAPETAARTYYPDNAPVDWTFENNTLTLNCPDETSRWLGKKIQITMDENSTRVQVDHVLKNIGMWPLKVSLWSISVMAPGGTLKVPQTPYIPHGGGSGETFAPGRSIVLWPFTPMDDPRFCWGSKFVEMRQDNQYDSKLKFGMLNEQKYALYELNGEVFRKEFDCFADQTYPDMNCNCEFFTMPDFLEVESLSPMLELVEGQSATHTEVWSLCPAEA